MRTKALPIALISILSSGLVLPPLSGQSLAEVARQEQERRKTIKGNAKVITNKDLGTAPPVTVSGAGDAAAGSAPAAAAVDAPDSAPKGDNPAPVEGSKDQALWSGRAKALQTQLSRDETFAVAMQSRINALTTDYTNESDPIKQAHLATERQAAVAELNRLTKQIEDDKKAIVALQDEARRAGVPAGWLR